METHTAARKERPTWGVDQVNIADFLVDHCKLGTRFDKDLTQRVCGILEVRRRCEFHLQSHYSFLVIMLTTTSISKGIHLDTVGNILIALLVRLYPYHPLVESVTIINYCMYCNVCMYTPRQG